MALLAEAFEKPRSKAIAVSGERRLASCRQTCLQGPHFQNKTGCT